MLYYARSVDPKMQQAINKILRVQSWPTRDTAEKSRMLIDYSATYSNAILTYKASDMVLHIDSDASYTTITEARSCYSGNFYLSDWPSPSSIKTTLERNDPINTEFKTIRNAAESETCDTFKNWKISISMQPAVIALEHKQPAKHPKTENYTTEVFVNSGIEPKR